MNEHREWTTAVEINTGLGVMRADIIWPTDEDTWFRIMIGGIILSPLYESREDAIDAAEAILFRLEEGVVLVEELEGVDAYPGEDVPTGWDAVDHKALYE